MPKPTLLQRAFGIPTQSYAGNPAAPLFPDPSSPYSQPEHVHGSKNSLKRPSSIRSSVSRTPSESGRSSSRRSVSFDDGASDGGRSYTSSLRSNDTYTSRTSAKQGGSPRRASWRSQQQPPLPSRSTDIGPSLRNGQNSGSLLVNGVRPASSKRTSRQYSSEDLLARAQMPYTPGQPPLPPPPLSQTEEAYAASRRRIEQLGQIEQGGLARSKSLMTSSTSTATLRAPTTSRSSQPQHPPNAGGRGNSIARSKSLNSPAGRAKTPEEIVAALEKAGLLDRVMEVVQEEDEATTPTPKVERTSWLDTEAVAAEPASVPVATLISDAPSAPLAPAESSVDAVEERVEEAAPVVAIERSSIAAANDPTAALEPALEPIAPPRAPIVLVEPVPISESLSPPIEPAPLPSPSSVYSEHDDPMHAAAAAIARPPTPAPPISMLPPGRGDPSDAFPIVLTTLDIQRQAAGALVIGFVRGLAPPFALLVRYTIDGWTSQHDVEATSLYSGHFEARAEVPSAACRIEMAIRLRDAAGREAWDSRDGQNFGADLPAVIERVSIVTPPAVVAPPVAVLETAATEDITEPVAVAVERTPSPVTFAPVTPIVEPTATEQPSEEPLAMPLYQPSASEGMSYLSAAPAIPVVAVAPTERSLPPSPADSDVSEASHSPSTAFTTPVSSELGKGSTGKARAAERPPRMTLTRTESEQGVRTVDLNMPVTPPVVLAQQATATNDYESPPVPPRSPKRVVTGPTPTPPAPAPAPVATMERAPSWGPNTKRLSGAASSAYTSTMTSPRRSKSVRSNASSAKGLMQQPRPLSLADSLPKARSVAQTLANEPTLLLSDVMPKAPPRVKDTPVVMPPMQQQQPESMVRSPAMAAMPTTSDQGQHRSMPSEDISQESSPDVSTIEPPRQQPSRTHSLSGASFSNEPFSSRRRPGVDTYDLPSHTLDPESAAESLVSSPEQTRAPSPNFMARRRVSSDNVRPMPTFEQDDQGSMYVPLPRARARSVMSDTAGSTGGRSDFFARSVMSLPTGAYRPRRNINRSAFGSEALVNAEPTMCAVAIASNAATSLTKSRFAGSGSKGRPSPAPAHVAAQYGLRSHVEFTEIASPPKKLGTSEVLVQVFAVGVDIWDRARVDTLVERGDGYGYIPGRSFCGKAVECGVDVSRVSKGDFVYGLGDLRKSGAIADLIVIDRDRVSPAPQGVLSVEQIATLPYAGVPAFQSMQTLCADLPRGSKVLVLNAHVGVGAVAMQLAGCLRRARDLWITAQVPITVADGDAICRAYGASETLRDEPLPVLNALHEASYDAVLDTVGGRRIYDAARRILHHEGLFVTVVGDELAPATVKSQWKAGFRSLRRAFIKKDKKAISYICPGLDEREDCRDALERLKDIAERGHVHPVVRRVLPFEDGGEAFAPAPDDGVVVRVLET